jgi:hypothetical protein
MRLCGTTNELLTWLTGSSHCYITAMALTLSRTGHQGIFAPPVWRLGISGILVGHTSSCMILAQERRSYPLSLETSPDSKRGEMRWNSFQSATNRSVHMPAQHVS